MERKVRCIIKRADERYGHMTAISTTLDNLQGHVGGLIEHAFIRNDLVIICNEEGKLKFLPFNFRVKYRLGGVSDIVGDVVIIGLENGEYVDVPITFAEWKEMLKGWGNL